jgi:CRP/FNR family transcriptional activator FtrB
MNSSGDLTRIPVRPAPTEAACNGFAGGRGGNSRCPRQEEAESAAAEACSMSNSGAGRDRRVVDPFDSQWRPPFHFRPKWSACFDALCLYSRYDAGTDAQTIDPVTAFRGLFQEGQKADRLHILLRGKVELFASISGRECGILLLSAGDLFMPAAALFDEPYLNSARAIRRVRVAMIDSEILRAEVRASPQLGLCLGQALAGQFRMAVRHIIDLKSRNAPQRLAAFLLRLIDESPIPNHAELPAPKKILAARIGISAATLSRTFQILADEGLVVRGHRVELRDRNRIQAFIGPRLYRDDAEDSLDVFAL